MYSMKKVDGKESNTAKGVNIATELNELKTLYITKKYSGIKWEECKAKNIKWEHTKSSKYHSLFLTMKDLFYLMEFICLVIAMETFKNRLIQRVINKKKFKKILANGYKKK